MIIAIVSLAMAPYPSGKGAVCKTVMQQFDSVRRLNTIGTDFFSSVCFSGLQQTFVLNRAAAFVPCLAEARINIFDGQQDFVLRPSFFFFKNYAAAMHTECIKALNKKIIV